MSSAKVVHHDKNSNEKTEVAGSRPSVADFDDNIARNRAAALPDPESVPIPPRAYRPTDGDTRRRRFRWLTEGMHSEALDALREAAERGTALREDLGKHAPDGRDAAPLVARVQQTSRLRARVQSLMNFASEMDDIAWSDVVRFLDAEVKEFRHVAEHEPTLESHYPALARFMALRSEAISEGIARARTDSTPPAAPATDPTRG